MKKILFILLAVLMTATVFVSCSKNDDDDSLPTDVMVGTWKVTNVKMTEDGTYIAWPFRTTTATFNSDGSYSGYGYFGNGTGTWSKSGNTINCYVSGTLYATYDVITYTSTESEMKMTCRNTTIWVKCKKQ